MGNGTKQNGSKLRECRTAKGWTFQDVGSRLGVAGQTVRNHEEEACGASQCMLRAYAQLFGRPVAFFLRAKPTIRANRRTKSAATAWERERPLTAAEECGE